MRVQEFEEASRELTRVVAAQPQNYEARHLLGLCFLKLQEFDQGIAELEAVCKAQPANLDVTYTLASAYIKANQTHKAEAIVEKLKAYDTAEAHLIVGSYYLTILEYRKALRELAHALDLGPNLPDVHSQLAYAHFFTGDQEVAMRMFKDELAINPQDSNAVALLGCLYRQNGRVEEAAALLNKAHQLRPHDLDIVFQLGLLAQSQGDNQQALRLLQSVEEKRPDDAPVHIVLVRLYSKLKRLEDVKRERAIVDRLNAERKNAPTVKERALFEVVNKPLE
jgi:tetratricopeptide (TPR) repeat protein